MRALYPILIALLFTGCIDPISLDVGPPEERLVVDGTLFEGSGPHVVRLSFPGAFSQGIEALRPAVRGAQVAIIDENGQEYPLSEGSAGRYATAASALTAEIGRAYSLRIQLADGRLYRSEPQVMPPPGTVANPVPRFERLPTLTGSVLQHVPSVTVRLDAVADEAETSYLRWTWTGVWETAFCTPPPLFSACYPCWIPASGRSLVNVADTPLSRGQALFNQLAIATPLTEVPERFGRGFVLNVRQESMTPDAFVYWRSMRDMRDRVGSLFDPPPDQVRGNLVNEADPNDYTLGYFTVASSETTTLCTRITDFPDRDPIPMQDFFLGNQQTCTVQWGGSLVRPEGFRELCDR